MINVFWPDYVEDHQPILVKLPLRSALLLAQRYTSYLLAKGRIKEPLPDHLQLEELLIVNWGWLDDDGTFTPPADSLLARQIMEPNRSPAGHVPASSSPTSSMPEDEG